MPLSEVAKKTGFSNEQLRIYALKGIIPGARQVRKGKLWMFQREALEKWWQEFNAPRPEELN
jgi:DNA-binding transcriptional MerR regulator